MIFDTRIGNIKYMINIFPDNAKRKYRNSESFYANQSSSASMTGKMCPYCVSVSEVPYICSME